MGLMKYLKQTFQEQLKTRNSDYREKLITFRRQPVTLRIERPTRLDRARSLGYKAKQGVIVVRQRVKRGNHIRARHIKGRRSKRQGMRKNLSKSYQWIAEERAASKYVNCEVINSYFVAKDGNHYWFEVIMADKDHPAIKNDKNLKWLKNAANNKRVSRGLTSAGKKSRGLASKGTGAEKLRPSRTAAHARKVKSQKRN